MKDELITLWMKGEKKFEKQFGFKLQDVTFSKIVEYLHQPRDPSSLAVTRILFGLAMLFDIPDERGGAVMDHRWGDPKICHFPLFPFLQAIPMPYMVLVYAGLWLGAVGIMLGYKYNISSITFAICYWYLLLIEKSYWNNHSYLFGLVGVLLACTDANCYWSLDAYLDPSKRKESVPYWNYFILKYQFFILYFMAGIKKGTAEWLSGYSVQNLSEHWVFAPFRIFLTVPQIDYLVVHWFIFVFDLTVALWMMWSRTRHVAMFFCALFHLMNSRLFRIGMFPWVCLATMPLFYPSAWPKLVAQFMRNKYCLMRKKLHWNKITCILTKENNVKSGIGKNIRECGTAKNKEYEASSELEKLNDLQDKVDNEEVLDAEENNEDLVEDFLRIKERETDTEKTSKHKVNAAKNFTVYMIMFYVVTQAFLPFSHFITKGYNNWTDGLYGYSWDMMVHTWEPHTVVVKVVDNEMNKEFYIDPWMFTPNDRWSRHGDMVYQYVRCLKNKILESTKKMKNPKISNNISIYIDVWCSMNGRFAQRMFDNTVDILTATWSPFEPISYLMPILDESISWRTTLDEIRKDVNSWSNYSDVTFFADYYAQEKFIPEELRNVTLFILKGLVSFEPEVTNDYIGQSIKLAKDDRISVSSGAFHKILNIGNSPAYYMYTFYNSTEVNNKNILKTSTPKLPIGNELARRLNNMIKFGNSVIKGIFKIFWVSDCDLR